VTFVCGGEECLQRMGHLLSRYGLPVQKAAGAFLDGIDVEAAAEGLFLREGRISGGFISPACGSSSLPKRRSSVRRFSDGGSDRRGRGISSSRSESSRRGIRRPYRTRHRAISGAPEAQSRRDRKRLSSRRVSGSGSSLSPRGPHRSDTALHRPDGFVPKIDRLGGTSWETVKERVKKSVREMAEELVSIYAAREVMGREAFSAPDRIYEEFCASFEFEETPDQTKAIEDIHADMSGGKPMDRLICGDAGFARPRWRCGPRLGPPWMVSRWLSSFPRRSWPSSTTRPFPGA